MRGQTVWRRLTALSAVLVVLVAAVLVGPSRDPALAAAPTDLPLPAAGELLAATVAVRAAPTMHARVVGVLHQFRADGQFQVVLALRARRGDDSRPWYELSVPGRPNGKRGWIEGRRVDLHPVANRIVVRIAARTIEVRRIADHRLLLRSVVAVGRPGAETPVGRNFYVQARFTSDDPFFGPFVLETSAYSKLSEWPGGGLAGIHGTDRPDLLGRAVSHGCIRVSNAVARSLERLAPLGTPIDLLP